MLIHVTCPNCSEPYDIADTFAGGVYRCTKCNTLMSVPKKHTPPSITATAPGMSKAASPDVIEERGSSQVSKASSVRTGSRTPVKTPAKAPAKKPAPKPGQKKGPPVPLWVEYKWHLVSLGALLAASVITYAVVKSRKTTVEVHEKIATVQQRPQSSYAFAYTQGVFTNDKPNVLGLPLTGNVMVVVDGGSELDAIRPALHKLLVAGLTGKPYEVQFSMFYATGADSCPVMASVPVNGADAGKKLAAWMGGFQPGAKRDDALATLKPALKLAVESINGASKNRHLVLITGRNLNSYWQNQLMTSLDPFTPYSTRLDLVVVDANVNEMADFADQFRKSRGAVVSVSATALMNAANALK